MDIAMDITDITMINDDKLHKMGYNPCNYGYYGYLIHLLQQVAGGLLTQLYINGITQESRPYNSGQMDL